MSRFKSVLRRHDGPLFRPADFDDSGCSLTLLKKGGVTEQLRAGFGSFRTSVFPGNDALPHPYAASAAWTGEQVLEIGAFATDGNYCDLWRIDFTEERTPVQYKNEGISWPFRIPLPELIVNSETIDGGCVK